MDRKLTILYASQTGNAQDVSERLWREAKHNRFFGPVKALDDFNIVDLVNENCVVFICSTCGQGEEPDNMKKFWKFLLRKNLPSNSLQNLKCAVLGLGDSSYVKYNFVAKRLNKRLMQLGATTILPLALADDQHDLGYDAVVDVWIPSLWKKLHEIYPLPNNIKLNINTTVPKIDARWRIDIINLPDYKLEEPHINFLDSVNMPNDIFFIKVKNNKRCTSECHFQDVRLIEFQTNGEHYKPGDVLYVRPNNSKEQINLFYNTLKSNGINYEPDMVIKISETDPDMPVPTPLQKEITFQKLCEQYFDLSAIPRRNIFNILSQISSSELEKEKCIEFNTAEGQEELYNYCNRPRRNIIEVLGDFPHAVENMTLGMLFEILTPIKPRAFSIASSFEAHKNELHVLVAIVKYKTKLVKERLGLCSNWLASLKPGDQVPVWIKKGSFKFPDSLESPIIMVGPGTGVAPFRNFICEAVQLNKADAKSLMLIFGCRQRDHDFLCKEDFIKMENEGKISLICAFSRDQDYKIYVQHKIEEYGEQIWYLLKSGGYIFVAGNSKNMPQSVREAFVNVSRKFGGFNEEDSENFIFSLEKQGKYQTETWA